MTKERRKKVIRQQHVLAQIMMSLFELFLLYCVVSTFRMEVEMVYDCSSFELFRGMIGFIGMFYLFSFIFPVLSHCEIHAHYYKKRMRVDDPYWKFANE